MSFYEAVLRFFGSRSRQGEFEPEMEELRNRREKREQEFKDRIARAQHYLTGSSWLDPEGKEAFLKEVYKGSVPRYLWYAMGDRQLSDEDIREIARTFRGSELSDFGDLELHNSHFSAVGTALRVRNAEKMVLELELGDDKFPLYQTGHYAPITGSSGDEPVVLFLKLYEEVDSK